MKEINKIVAFYEQKKQEGLRAALAMVIHVSGSSYRQVGARMLIVENGEWEGGISGGCLEGDVLKKAKAAIIKHKSSIITYDTTQNDKDQIGVGLGCEGVIHILITPIDNALENNVINILKRLVAQQKRHILLTVLQDNTSLNLKMGDVCCYESAALPQTAQMAYKPFVEQVIATKKSRIIELSLPSRGQLRVLIELLEAPIHLFIVGSNYDIYPLIEVANLLGWRISLMANLLKIDKRKLHLVHKAYHHKNVDFPNSLTQRTAIILMTHDYNKDAQFLAHSLQTKAEYIGILGPKKRGERLIEQLRQVQPHLVENNTNKIHFPIGLDIGGITPEEIALSMVAEIQAFFAKRQGGFLHKRPIPIHAEF